jgi:hypothetical protein
MGECRWVHLMAYNIGMSVGKEQQQEEYVLSMKTVTWQKDSHSLFDYEFNKNVIQNTVEFVLSLKCAFIYRNHQGTPSPIQPAKSPSTKPTPSSPAYNPTCSFSAPSSLGRRPSEPRSISTARLKSGVYTLRMASWTNCRRREGRKSST